jgi:hypothetical protein
MMTTADRIRQCAQTASDLTEMFADRFSANPGMTTTAKDILDALQELWVSAYQAGREDGQSR